MLKVDIVFSGGFNFIELGYLRGVRDVTQKADQTCSWIIFDVIFHRNDELHAFDLSQSSHFMIFYEIQTQKLIH